MLYRRRGTWYNSRCRRSERGKASCQSRRERRLLRRTSAPGTIISSWKPGKRASSCKGTEVKSIRLGQCNLKDCYGTVKDGELWVYGMHISPYEKGSFSNTDPIRPKRMLMHKAEIRKLQAQRDAEGPGDRSPERLSEGRPREGWKSACARAKSSTTSGTTWPSATRSGISSAPLPAGNDPPAANFNMGVYLVSTGTRKDRISVRRPCTASKTGT